MINLESKKSRYIFFLANIAICLIFMGVFLPQSQSPMDGLKAMFSYHNLVDTDAFYVGGFSGAYLNVALCLGFALLMFALTKTEIGSLEMAGLYLVFGYSFYGKTLVGVVPLMLGAYLYQVRKGRPLREKSAMACFAAALSPIVTVLMNGTGALGPGSPLAIVTGLVVGLVSGYLVSWVSGWMGDTLQGRSILLGAACAGVTAVFVAGVLRSFGLGHEANVDPAYMDQMYKWPITLSMAAFYGFALLAGILGGGSFKNALKNQTSKTCSADVCQEESFAASLINIGIVGLVLIAYFAILPNTEMHGEMFAGVATAAAFAPRAMTLRGALPFWLGFIGFNFLSAGCSGALAGEGFVESGLLKIASRATLMGTFVGANIAPLMRQVGLKRGIAMGCVYAVVVAKTAGLHDQTLLYNSGFAIALTVILFHSVSENWQKKIDREVL